jgi:hypothetical protein
MVYLWTALVAHIVQRRMMGLLMNRELEKVVEEGLGIYHEV